MPSRSSSSLTSAAIAFASERWERMGPHFHSLFQFLLVGLNGAFLTGDRLKAYVQQVRPDGKIDLILQQQGQKAVFDFSEILLEHIRLNGGKTSLGDKSPAEEIYTIFGVSKKVFKKAVGDLYKRRLIDIRPDGLVLMK